MKKLLIVLILLFLPYFALANCNNSGVTIVFINGIFGNLDTATNDMYEFQGKFQKRYPNENVNFVTGFNESHLAGIGDLISAVQQTCNDKNLDIDLTTILNKIHSQVLTKKILLVGHSQGTFYTNAAYDYLINNGNVSKDSIGVYNIATPASYVAGDGKYITSSTDKVINETVRNLTGPLCTQKPLPANVDIELSQEQKSEKYAGHSFSNIYLAKESDRIISEIKEAIDRLKVSESEIKECFKAPGENITYRFKRFLVSFVDETIDVGKEDNGAVFRTDILLTKGRDFLAWLFGEKNTKPVLAKNSENNEKEEENNNQTIIETKNNSNNDEKEDYSGKGGPNPDLMSEQDYQDLIDDLAERIDFLTSQVNDFLNNNQEQNIDDNLENILAENENKEDNQLENSQIEDNNNNENQNSVSEGGPIAYPKILISEIQVGGQTDAKEEFVELYNPNGQDVDLTGWYLQRQTENGKSYSSYASSTLFEGKKIPAMGYFLIARSGYFPNLADVFTTNSISNDNSFVLKNPNGEVSDKVGFGNAQDFETDFFSKNPISGQTIGRKVLNESDEKDTNDNSVDFELQNSTPKNKNITYFEKQPKNSDLLAPKISFELNAVQTSLSFNINFIIEDIAETTTPSGVASYVFRWKTNGDENWQEDAPINIGGDIIATGVRNFTGQDGKTYYFQAKSKDIIGNESDWQPETFAETKIEIPKKILINEVQIAGHTDEKEDFIELYNPNNEDVDLTGWYLQRKTATGEKYVSYATSALFENKIIKAKGYFLISRQDYFSDLADIFVSDPITDNNSLVLKRKDQSVSDKVGWGIASDFETIAALSPNKGQSIDRKIIGQDTDNNQQDFVIRDNPTPRESFIKAVIQDNSNYSNNCDGEFYNLSLSWQSLVEDIDHFQLQYKFNDENWQNWIAETTETTSNFKAVYSILDIKNIYSFRVKVFDINGNESEWNQIDIDLSAPVVINEVGLFGTKENPDNQWIELYNKTDNDIDLTGWKLQLQSSEIQLFGTILANGYLVLEQNKDFTDSLRTNRLALKDNSNRYIDELFNPVGWGQDYFINGENYYSLERISSFAYGWEKDNWKTSKSNTLSTPGCQNSYYQFYTLLPRNIYRNTTLSAFLSPYFSNNDVKILEGIVLNINSGIVIKSSNNKIIVDGTIKSIGTQDNQIIFTWAKEDSLGGDWFGIELTSKSKDSEFNYTIFKYGGSDPLNFGAVLRVIESSAKILNCVFEDNFNKGILLRGSSSLIENSSFLNINRVDRNINDRGAVAISSEGGSDKIKNCIFDGNNIGISVLDWNNSEKDELIDSKILIQDNIFRNNGEPIYIFTFNHELFSGNLAENNYHNSIFVFWAMESEQNITLEADLPYYTDKPFDIPENTTLTLSPGVIMHIRGINIFGTLKAIGTTENPIIFTSSYDEPRPGHWHGLSFHPTSKNSELEYVDISYGGNFYYGPPAFGAAIKVESCDVLLKNSYLHHNQNAGVWLINSNSIVDNVNFYDHTTAEGFVKDAKVIHIQGGSPEIRNSYFENQKYGIILEWYDDNSGNKILPTPNLENNIFVGTEIWNGDVFDLTIPQ